MVMFVFPLVQHSWVGCTLRKAKVKYSGFGFGSSHVSLKVREAVCVPGDPDITHPSLFKGARSPLVLAWPCLSYCRVWPYLVRRGYLVFCAVLPLWVQHCISIYTMWVYNYLLLGGLKYYRLYAYLRV